jgi:hypothetical protein
MHGIEKKVTRIERLKNRIMKFYHRMFPDKLSPKVHNTPEEMSPA